MVTRGPTVSAKLFRRKDKKKNNVVSGVYAKTFVTGKQNK